jgi:intracellular multiplication protein IcmJ
MLDIQLSANFENWKLYWLRRNHPRFKEIAQKVFLRDHYTCQYCGFHVDHVDFEVVNFDNNYQNNKAPNLVTACPICAQCFFLESIGTGSFGGGVLVYLPEMSQVQLNALANHSFVVMQRKAKESIVAESILRDFRFRASDVEKIFGDGMSDPAKFGTLMLTAQLSHDKLHHILSPLRLLPLKARFTEFTEAAAKAMGELDGQP